MVVVADFMLESSGIYPWWTGVRVLGEHVALCLCSLIAAVKISSTATASAVRADMVRMGYSLSSHVTDVDSDDDDHYWNYEEQYTQMDDDEVEDMIETLDIWSMLLAVNFKHRLRANADLTMGTAPRQVAT